MISSQKAKILTRHDQNLNVDTDEYQVKHDTYINTKTCVNRAYIESKYGNRKTTREETRERNSCRSNEIMK